MLHKNSTRTFSHPPLILRGVNCRKLTSRVNPSRVRIELVSKRKSRSPCTGNDNDWYKYWLRLFGHLSLNFAAVKSAKFVLDSPLRPPAFQTEQRIGNVGKVGSDCDVLTSPHSVHVGLSNQPWELTRTKCSRPPSPQKNTGWENV